MLEEEKNILNKKLKSQIISPKILLDHLRVIDEDSRKSAQYQDPSHFPFYYYLSKFLKCKSLVHIGFDLALPSCCFLQGSKTAEEILGFQQSSKIFYSPSLAIRNIKDVKGKNFNIDYYYGKINDFNFIKKIEKNFDLFLITEKFSIDQMNEFLDTCWQYLNLEGYIVVDYLKSEKKIGDVFRSFCKNKNRTPVEFSTRYGIGIVQK